jgi:hypothetical protein
MNVADARERGGRPQASVNTGHALLSESVHGDNAGRLGGFRGGIDSGARHVSFPMAALCTPSAHACASKA